MQHNDSKMDDSFINIDQGRYALNEAATDRNYQSIMARAPWLENLWEDLQRVILMNASARSKYPKMVAIADRIASAVSPSAVCRSGCSSCCHISVVINQIEADRIAAASGKPLKAAVSDITSSPMKIGQVADAHFGVACPFLVDGLCSIYEHRPLSCRLHFNIGADSFFCDTRISPEKSVVPNINLERYWIAHAMIFNKECHADIRDFFD